MVSDHRALRNAYPSPVSAFRESDLTMPSAAESCRNRHFRLQRPVHRALVGDFEDLCALRRVEIAFEGEHALDAVDAAFPGFALGAVVVF